MHHRDGQPVLDGIAAALLGAPEAIDLHQPERPVAQRHPLELLEDGVVLPEGRGHIHHPVRSGHAEVAELVAGLGIEHLDVLLEHLDAVECASVDLLDRLAGPVGGGAGKDNRLPGLDPLGQRVAVGAGLPRPQWGDARLG